MRRHGNHDFSYFFQEGFSNMFTHGFMSFAAIGITVACLLIMGTFSLVAVNADATLSDLEEENQVLAFVDERLTEEEARALEGELLKVPNVASVQFISRSDALDEFKSDYEDEALFQGLPDSTLRHRFAVTPVDISRQAQLKEDLMDVDGIAKVNAWDALSDGFITIRNIAAVVCVALIAVLFLVSVFIIANTIKLTTFDRREEIAIMKMVGATNGFIRWPFVYEGFLMGLLSAVIAFFLQWGLYGIITSGIAGSDTFAIVSVVPFSAIWLPVALIFAAVGMLIGVGGSVSAIRQFLKV